MDTDIIPRPLSRVAVGGFALALVAALLLPLSGIGYRLGLWDFRPGLTVFRWAAYAGVAAAVLSLRSVLCALRKCATWICTGCDWSYRWSRGNLDSLAVVAGREKCANDS